jgi:hypothetical protein
MDLAKSPSDGTLMWLTPPSFCGRSPQHISYCRSKWFAQKHAGLSQDRVPSGRASLYQFVVTN